MKALQVTFLSEQKSKLAELFTMHFIKKCI